MANQRKTDGSLIAFGHETAAEHLRNALQVLTAASVVGFDFDDVTAVANRVRRALLEIEAPPLVTYDVTDKGRAELADSANYWRPLGSPAVLR